MEDKEIGELWCIYSGDKDPADIAVRGLIRKLVEERAVKYRFFDTFRDNALVCEFQALQDFGISVDEWNKS